MTHWLVSIYDVETDQLVGEHEARTPERSEVRRLWSIPAGVAIPVLPVTEDKLAFVNGLLTDPIELVPGRAAYLEEFSDYLGETVTD